MYDGLYEVTCARVIASRMKGIGRPGRLSIASPKRLYTYKASCY
jgi:hypothetical protein